MFAALLGLLIGVIIYHLSESIPKILPYSVMLLLTGLAIGGINLATGGKLSLISNIEFPPKIIS